MELISKETLKSAVRAFSKDLDFRCTVNSIVNMQPTIDAIPKADYENRLKADMVAMLTELQLEIEEMSGLVTEIHGEEWNEINVIHSQDVLSFIQQKINALGGKKMKVIDKDRCITVEDARNQVFAVLTDLSLEIDALYNDRPSNYNHSQRKDLYADIKALVFNKMEEWKSL